MQTHLPTGRALSGGKNLRSKVRRFFLPAGLAESVAGSGSIGAFGSPGMNRWWRLNVTKLKALRIGGQQLTDEGMAHVKNFSELRELRLEGRKLTKNGLAYLAALKKLQKLEILYCTALNSEGMAPLNGLSDLRELEIIYCNALNAAATIHLSGLNKLKKLRISSLEDDALKGIKGLTNLEGLDLNYTWITDAALEHMSGLTGLRSLNLMKTKITDVGLKHLSGLTNLQDLALGDNKITDAGLQYLSGLTKLRDLYLSECKITGPGLKHLGGLTSLQDLRLNANPITDESLAHLQNLKGLKYLYLTGTKVTDEGVLALKKALPKTSVHDYSGQEVSLDKKSAPRPKVAVEDISKIAPSFSLSAEKFSEEYKENRNAAEEKYKGKVVELTGVVKSMGRNIADDSYISLEAGKVLFGVMCVTADAEPWAKVAPGQKVKLKGKWPEFSVGAALIYCVFLDTGKYEATALSAEQLAKEYVADPEATTKKYKDKYLVISGEVMDRDFNSAGAASITLKVDSKVRVKCHFTAFESKQTRSLKVGQRVKAIGQYTLNFDKDEVGLYFCLPITQP
jgi:Leucine-rich repeat (LRR) protein